MKLSIRERIMLSGLLPETGNIAQIRILGDLRRELGFTEEENKIYCIKIDGDRITWNDQKDEFKDVPIGEVATDLIRKRLKEMDDKKKLTEQHIPLWDKFIEGE